MRITPRCLPESEPGVDAAAVSTQRRDGGCRPRAGGGCKAHCDLCAGRRKRIEAASDSRLFGFDFLTLETLIHSGNKHANASVKE